MNHRERFLAIVVLSSIIVLGAGFGVLKLLVEPQEIKLMKRLSSFPEIVRQCAINRAPHNLVHYLRDLAKGIGFHCIEKTPDHGFRQITMKAKPIKSPDDLKGIKIRLPVAPYLIALFQALGASPTPINFGEVYSALQTGLVDGQENPLILIDTAKLYEVQKYCSMTNHVWACIHYSFGNLYWDKLPNDLKDLSTRHFNAAAMTERDDWQKMTADETKNLTAKGMAFNTPDVKPFREALKKAGFFGDMKKKSGDKAWGLLEKYVGPLA